MTIKRAFGGFLLASLLVISHSSPAISAVSQACDRAAVQAAKKTGIPVKILLTITRIETGRTRQNQTEPWPWTLNVNGAGHWFKTKAAALSYAKDQRQNGSKNFDVGCFQINYRWHGSHFSSLEKMFDPNANAAYAAAFLKSLFLETQSWPIAIGAFHSRTDQYAQLYKARYKKQFEQLTIPSAVKASLQNAVFPLPSETFQPISLGSLVPISTFVRNPPLVPQLN